MPDPQSSSAEPSRERAFVAFSGGGAKGLVHLGALEVLEKLNLDIKGFAGTSAGAIVATLAATGFKRKELFDPETKASIFDLLKDVDPKLSNPTRVFGMNWWRVKYFRQFGRWFPYVLVFSAVVFPAAAGWIWRFENWPVHLRPITSFFLILFFGGYLYILFHLAVGGLAKLNIFRHALAALLQDKLFPGETDRIVTFSDFGGDTGRPELKIVATNLTTRELELFCRDDTPDTPVADAIAASVCIPLVFKAHRIGDNLYADGGLVSNLPAWCFDEERLLDPDALTIAVDIEDDKPSPITSPASFLNALVRAAIFGSSRLNLRAAEHSTLVELRSKTVGLLDFDMTWDQAKIAFRDSVASAEAKIALDLVERRENFREVSRVLNQSSTLFLQAFGLLKTTDKKPGTIRTAIALRENGMKHALRLRYGCNFDDMPDQGLLLPINGSLAGEVWQNGAYQFECCPIDASIDFPNAGQKRWKSLVWTEMTWLLAVPIWVGETRISSDPDFVVTLDGNTHLHLGEDLTDDIFDQLAAEISKQARIMVEDFNRNARNPAHE